MKKWIILICLLIPALVFSGNLQQQHIAILGNYAAGGGGSCVEEVSYDTSDSTQEAARFKKYVANLFTWDGTAIDKIQVHMTEVGDISAQTWTICLYQDNGSDLPNGTLYDANATCTFSGADFVNGYFGCTFPATVTPPNGAKFHLSVNRAGAENGSNYLNISYENTGSGEDLTQSDADPPVSWGTADFTARYRVKFFSGTCTGD